MLSFANSFKKYIPYIYLYKHKRPVKAVILPSAPTTFYSPLGKVLETFTNISTTFSELCKVQKIIKRGASGYRKRLQDSFFVAVHK